MTVDPLAATEALATKATSTVASELRRAAAALTAAGVESPRLEARLLLRHVLGVTMETLVGYPERSVGEYERTALRPLVARRAAREPLAYILGQREFWSLSFRLTPETLIPRPDSETLIDAALARIGKPDRPLRILDLGTGSGCLLLSLLSELPDAWGVGVDLSAAALDVACGNARVLGLADRASWVHGNWSDAICGDFDVIVSNPPYVAQAELTRLAPEVAQFEPRLALDGGSDGLECLRAIIPGLSELGNADSVFLLEIGVDQAEPVSALLLDHGLQRIETVADLSGVPRCLVARTSGNKKKLGTHIVPDYCLRRREAIEPRNRWVRRMAPTNQPISPTPSAGRAGKSAGE